MQRLVLALSELENAYRNHKLLTEPGEGARSHWNNVFI